MCELAPSIYAADYINIKDQLIEIEKADVKYLHVDIMDGHFVPNLSFGPEFVSVLRKSTNMILDVHLMISEPGNFLQDFINAGADIITLHAEVNEAVEEMLNYIHSKGKKAGIVLKPSTSLDEIAENIWENIDVIQIMTVEPGLSGQKFINDSYEKIRKTRGRIAKEILKNPQRSIDLEVDGDITPANLKSVMSAGANVIVAGKGLFAGNLAKNLNIYRSILNEGDQNAVFNRN